jgi:hypothetical protein
VIVDNHLIVTFLIIVAIIVLFLGRPKDLLALEAKEVYFLIL